MSDLNVSYESGRGNLVVLFGSGRWGSLNWLSFSGVALFLII